MSTIYLRVKIKSLAAEATMIHREEIKRKKRNHKIFLKTGTNPNVGVIYNGTSYEVRHDDVFWGLRQHRTIDVRNESRAALLAYGFLRGTSYRKIERETRKSIGSGMITRVAELAFKYMDSVAKREPGMTKDAVYSMVDAWLQVEPTEVAKAA